jgi:excinuclease ABC subunit C
MMLELDCGQEFDTERDEEFFSALPSRAGVFLLESSTPGGQPYLARSADLRRAAERLLRPAEGFSKRLNLRVVVRGVRYRVTGSKFEQLLTMYEHARRIFPRRYRDFLRLRPPAMLKVNLRNEYPRCYVTRRIAAGGGSYFGPFASRRAAENFAEEFLDLFKIRRCQIKIRRDPNFPGCIYSEMKMCLAPCFGGCTKGEYDAEVARVLETLTSSGESLQNSLEREREAASESLDFERAAATHKKIEKAAGVLRALPELARQVDRLDAVILQRAPEENAVVLFVIRGGRIAAMIPLRFGELSSEPRPVEAILREQLEGSAAAGEANVAPVTGNAATPLGIPGHDTRPTDSFSGARPELSEHLALIARWYYSKPREGEILFHDGDWPYRRIIRACSRVLASTAS